MYSATLIGPAILIRCISSLFIDERFVREVLSLDDDDSLGSAIFDEYLEADDETNLLQVIALVAYDEVKVVEVLHNEDNLRPAEIILQFVVPGQLSVCKKEK